MFKITDKGIVLKIKIIPNSSKNEITADNDLIKVKVTAQPIENKANKALIELLSKEYKIPKTKIEIIKGLTSKEKSVLLEVSDENKINEIKTKLKL